MPAKAAAKKNMSALKRARQSEKLNAKNRMVRSRVKGSIKAVETAVQSSDVELAKTQLHTAIKVIDTARLKGVIHKNSASRKISRLSKKVNSLA